MTLRAPLALAELLLGWLLITSVGEHGDPWPVAGAVVLAAGGYVVGHAVPARARPWIGAALGATALVAVVAGSGPLGDVLGGPLGYANANAALAAQGGAAFGLLTAARSRRARLAGAVGVAAALVLTVLIGAAAATVGMVLVLVAAIAPAGAAARVSVALSLAAVVGGTAVAFVLGVTGEDGVGSEALTGRRLDLWSDGVDAIPEHPWLGVGGREFPMASPTAAADSDTREAHAELLQRTVENGLPGALLEAAAVAAVVIGLARRGWAPGAPRTALVGLAGLCGLAANAGVDYVLAFPFVLALGFAVAGLGSAEPRWHRPRRARPGSSERPTSAT